MGAANAIKDYSALIDVQVKAFIEKTNAAFPADAASLTIEDQRELYNAMCLKFRVDYPPGVSSRNSLINSQVAESTQTWQVPVRHYSPENSAAKKSPVQLVYLHGGGFVVGGLDSHDDVCAEIAHHTGHELTSVDYRLSPEHKHPAALDDVITTINSLWVTNRQPIILCGDSAGANLSAAACHALRKLNNTATEPVLIAGQVLIYPGLGGDTAQGSYVTHAQAPMLSTDDVHFYSRIRCHSEDDLHDPLFAPLRDNDFSGLPPTVVISAECDPLSDDGREYCSRIQQADGKAHWINEEGLVHGYLRARHSTDRAAASFHRIVSAISALADEKWPYA